LSSSPRRHTVRQTSTSVIPGVGRTVVCGLLSSSVCFFHLFKTRTTTRLSLSFGITNEPYIRVYIHRIYRRNASDGGSWKFVLTVGGSKINGTCTHRPGRYNYYRRGRRSERTLLRSPFPAVRLECSDSFSLRSPRVT